MDTTLFSIIGGNSLEQWLTAVSYMLGGFLAGKLFYWISSNVFRKISRKTKTKIDDIILSVAERPLVFLIGLIGIRLGIGGLDIDPEFFAWATKVFHILITFSVAWIVVRVVDSIIHEYLVPYVEKTEGTLDDQLLPIARKAVKFLIWGLAILVALNNAGYNIGALLAGLGIGGVAIALAAKDTLSNLFGSLSIFIDQPFKINDRIKIAGYDGVISEIGIRTSRLRTLDNRVVTVPNSLFAAGVVENVSSEPNTKYTNVLELPSGAQPEKVEEALRILKGLADDDPDLDPGTVAAVTGFGEGVLKITFIVYIKKSANYFKTVNGVNLEIIKRFKAADIGLAVPARMVMNRS